jgi:glycosyltransferase involved in cell wall biosynthesis
MDDPAADPAALPAVLVYRDRIVPRSEVHFMRRQYLGFSRLRPVWVGCRTDTGLADLGVAPLILGGEGALGPLRRLLFKQAGVVPDLTALRAREPRIVHAQFGRGGALALPIARALGLRLVVTFHGGDATKSTHYRRRLLPTVYQRRLACLQQEAAAFICVSDFIRATLLDRGFPADKLVVLRNGVEIPAQVAAPVRDRPYVLFVGRLTAKKGLIHLLHAQRLLGGAGPGLVVIGDGADAVVLRREAGDLPDVRFLGWQDNAAVRSWMRGALAVCVPSVTAASGDSEGLPTVAIEAMAEGVPVIGSRHAGIVEAIADGITGILVPEASPETLAQAIARLRDAPSIQIAMGRAGRARATAEFNASVQSRKLEDLLLSFV